jgi:hypothetical protein
MMAQTFTSMGGNSGKGVQMTASINRTTWHASVNTCTHCRVSCMVLVLLKDVAAISVVS